MTILIIGAGAAGLMAAYTLQMEGKSTMEDFIILEASSKHLGRLKKTDTFTTDFPIDLGGEWIHVDPSILNTIVNDPSRVVDVETTPYKTEYYEWDGTEMYPVTLKRANDHIFVNYTWYDFFNDYIAVDVMDKITFDCQVTNIDWGNDSSSSSPGGGEVNVTCLDGTEFSGSQVIITVPMKILQDEDILFDPPLPDDFIDAVHTPLMAAGLKVFFKFRTVFYPESFAVEADFERLEYRESDRYFYDETYGQPETSSSDNILGMAAFGELAEQYVGLSEDEIVQSILADLDDIFDGAATENYIDSIVQDWNAEPYIRGAYTFYARKWRAIDTLRKPLGDGRLFFAGEAIPIEESDYENGFAHGAALSGRRAAEKAMGIYDDSSAPSPRHISTSFVFLQMGLWLSSTLLLSYGFM